MAWLGQLGQSLAEQATGVVQAAAGLADLVRRVMLARSYSTMSTPLQQRNS